MEKREVDYHLVLKDLEEKRDKLNAAIAGIRVMLGIHNQADNESVLATHSANSLLEIPSDSFFGMPFLAAAVKYLKIAKRKQSTKDIAEALESGGITHSSSDFTATISTTLSREARKNDGQVVKVGRGEWGLTEWYPGRPRSRNTKQDNIESDSAEDHCTEVGGGDSAELESEVRQ